MAVDNTEDGLPPSPDEVIEKLRDLVSPKYLEYDTASMHIRSSALVGRLKSLNRAANVATRARKDATAAARHEMDEAHLGLQNLQYEKRHLEREIEKCRQFACVVLPVSVWLVLKVVLVPYTRTSLFIVSRSSSS